jgi:thiamine-phosphate pyrophosphorylase
VTGVSPKLSEPTFYPIVDADACRAYGHDPLVVATACFRGGATLLQLRQKRARGADALALAGAVVSAARPYGAAVIVNDRADIARLAGAAGVHVGQEDMTVEDVRLVVGPQTLVGLSTHDEAQIDDARKRTVDYIAVGPVYETATKDTGYTPRGLDLVRYAARGDRAIAAIGGITLDRTREVIAAGATLVVVISDILRGDPERRTRQFIDHLHV